MNCIELHNGIHKIIDVYYRLGFWHRGDVATVKDTSFKYFYSTMYLMFPISLISGAMVSENKNESMLLVQSAIISTVMLVRLLYIMWKQKEIYESLHRIGVYSIKDADDFYVVDNKLRNFMKWTTYFYYYVMVVGACITIGVPLIGSEKKLFVNVGFPLDYKNNDLAYWIACLFIFTEVYISLICVSFPLIIWYLLFNCALKYQVLGSELRNMSVNKKMKKPTIEKLKTSEVENVFNRDLIAGIKSHSAINESIQQLESFLSQLFALQLATSAACICASVYVLAFSNITSMIEFFIYLFYLVYNICDIFMVMYFGNEIELLSAGLLYCLFQSNWINQSQSCKKMIIFFGEFLKQPQQLVILKLYPVTLETFTRILNGAYSMFNILKTLTI